ncbi:MAG: type IX secretion system sortase PorU, partial [Muribaculaceae bacterium]|nr:type IX secretion system sortase PorU [Muribaculaceae bacterium]
AARALLDYIDISYPRQINLGGGYLKFNAQATGVTLSGADASTEVWDVTDPLEIKGMTLTLSGSEASWINQYAGNRDYVAWKPGSSLPVPTYVGRVANQNLHGLPNADMVIFAPAEFLSQAERLADIHRNGSDSLTVHVVDQELVFNEFGSGMAHPNALRRMLKMLYDRQGDTRLKYAVMFGRGSYDNRRLTQAVKRRRNMMPLWQSPASTDENSSFTTDDIFGFLEDGSGLDMVRDKLSIAVGRIPAANVSDAKIAVDKIVQYLTSMPKKSWKHRMVLLADDAGAAVHVTQTEDMWQNMQAQNAGGRFLYDKVYIDAYDRIDGGYPLGRTELYRALNEGVLLWTYVGHGNPSSLTGDKMVMPTDITSLYLRQFPILYAATCEFLRWDGDDYSGAELMHFMSDGGTIATISSTRLALIANNGDLTKCIGDMFTHTDADGRFLTLGEIYRQAKNKIDNDLNRNKLRYVLMGDPALRPAAPEAVAELTHVNDVPLVNIDQPTLMANQNITLRGRIISSSGEMLNDFDGVVNMCIYDADRSITTHGRVDDPKEDPVQYTFDQRGQLLFSGNAPVNGGEFVLTMAMPAQIAENFRQATVSMYAYSTSIPVEAAGTCRNMYVYGYDDSVTDSLAPEITFLALNHDGFRSGDNVNESPMLIANVSDDRGINLSMSGVGHVMNITIDGTRTYTDVATYYTPDVVSDVNRIGGSIAYQLSDLMPGRHTARLRVWDTVGNMAERSIDFNVVTGMAPGIFDVYTDANPATTQANFYVKHDRPDSRMTVTVTVYNLLGQPVWSSSASGRSDMFITSPLTWDLTDNSGRRVPRGIYLYRATISGDGGEATSPGRKIAVAAQ